MELRQKSYDGMGQNLYGQCFKLVFLEAMKRVDDLATMPLAVEQVLGVDEFVFCRADRVSLKDSKKKLAPILCGKYFRSHNSRHGDSFGAYTPFVWRPKTTMLFGYLTQYCPLIEKAPHKHIWAVAREEKKVFEYPGCWVDPMAPATTAAGAGDGAAGAQTTTPTCSPPMSPDASVLDNDNVLVSVASYPSPRPLSLRSEYFAETMEKTAEGADCVASRTCSSIKRVMSCVGDYQADSSGGTGAASGSPPKRTKR